MSKPASKDSALVRPFAADSPLVDPAFDRFKRLPFAQRIAKILALRSDPSSIVVLIHGVWGEGKTTVLEFVEKELRTFDKVVPVRFNPWRVVDETSLLLAFFATIATALDKPTKTMKEKLGDAFMKYGEAASEFSLDIHGAKLSVGHALPKLGQTLSLVTLDEKRERIEQALHNAGVRVIVFLDDIDRLDRKEAQGVFKLLKLTANFANVSYLLAFDRDVVAKAISEQYGDGEHRAGYDYLEKVIQVNLSLPLADNEALTKLCLDLLQDALTTSEITLTAEQEKEFQLAFLQHIAPDLRTPRIAKLYANAVAFTLPLLADEINPIDLLLLEAIKSFHPTLHEHIRQHPALYTGQFGWEINKALDESKQSQATLIRHLESIGPAAEHARHLLTQLFPQLHELFRTGQYGSVNDDRSQREQRVALLDFLKRYLTCSIPLGDISDKEIDDYLRRVPSMTDAEVNYGYRGLVRDGQELALLVKLKTRIQQLPTAIGEFVGRAIARNGGLLPDRPEEFNRLLSIAGLVIRELVQRLPATDRKRFAKEILAEAQPLHFAVICFDWMRLQPNQHETERLFSKKDEDDLRLVFADRIAHHAATTSLLAGRPSEFGPLLHIWQKAKGSAPVHAHIGDVFASTPAAAEIFLNLFANHSLRPGIDQASYPAIKSFVLPTRLLRACRECGLFNPARTDYAAGLAASFAALHKTLGRNSQAPSASHAGARPPKTGKTNP